MSEVYLNAMTEEVVQPQYDENGAEGHVAEQLTEEVTNPQINQSSMATDNVDDMSDSEFDDFIRNLSANSDSEVQAARNETGTAEPAEDKGKQAAAENEPFRVFKTQAEYQQNINKIIGERLKKTRQVTEALDSVKAQAKHFYGGDDGDSALMQLMEDLQAQNAERQGVDVKEYQRRMQDSIDAERYRAEVQAKKDMERQVDEKKQQWASESEELKRVVPDFDFGRAMQDKAFYDSIVSGMSVASAYISTQQRQTAAANKPQRRAISEVGNMSQGHSGKVEANPVAMSDKEFTNYINRIKRG